MNVKSRLRESRKKAGLTQSETAALAGISRQAYTAIESGKAVPSTEIALRLAYKLQVKVEDLFYLEDTAEEDIIQAELVSDAPAEDKIRVQLFEVGPRLLARPLVGDSALSPADAVIIDNPSSDTRVNVKLINKAFGRVPTLVLSGGDPSIPILAAILREQGIRLVWTNASSLASLRALAKGEAHLAGCNYLDKFTGIYNSPVVKAIVPFPCTVIRFVREQQGFIVQRGNPKHIYQVDDLMRPDISFINKQAGSGSRGLLHRLMNYKHLSPLKIKGHNNCVTDDLSLTKVILAELADCGVGVEAAALAAGLGFLSLAEEPYDLVIPDHFLKLPAMQRLLDVLKSHELGSQLEALGGYDTSLMGKAY